MMKIRDFLQKIQNLPLNKRKIILWVIVVILGTALFGLWIKITKERLKNIKIEESIEKYNIPSFEKTLEIPELGQLEEKEEKNEDIAKIEKLINYFQEHPEKLEELQKNPEKIELLRKYLEEHPEKTEEIINNPEKLEDILKELGNNPAK